MRGSVRGCVRGCVYSGVLEHLIELQGRYDTSRLKFDEEVR